MPCPQVNLRAAVDHLHGVACCVQQVAEVATADAPLPQVQRGMATKLTKDRMVSIPKKATLNMKLLLVPATQYGVGSSISMIKFCW